MLFSFEIHSNSLFCSALLYVFPAQWATNTHQVGFRLVLRKFITERNAHGLLAVAVGNVKSGAMRLFWECPVQTADWMTFLAKLYPIHNVAGKPSDASHYFIFQVLNFMRSYIARLQHLFPHYIEPIPSHITQDDLEFLRSKGVLDFPAPSIRDKLWASYFELVHPNLPVLDRDRVLRSLTLHTGEPKISLLLFHCVMLSARTFLYARQHTLTKPAALESMFTRARLLYDLGWERDKLVLLQSLLLMTYYPQPIDKARSPIHLMAQAVPLAYSLGLHINPTDMPLNPREKILRKQLWWSVYLRERLLSIDQGSPCIIDDGEHDVPMLTRSDFEHVPSCLTKSGIVISAACGPESDDNLHRQMADMFIEMVKVVVILGRIPPIFIPGYDSWPHIQETSGLSTQCPRLDLNKLGTISCDLIFWAADAPLETFCAKNKARLGRRRRPRDILLIQHSLLCALYHTANIHLAYLHWLKVISSSRDALEYASRTLWDAARPLIHLAEGLLDRGILSPYQVIGPSVIRPLLLCKIMTDNTQSWMTPFMEPCRIATLVEKLGSNDPYFLHGLSSLQFGLDVPAHQKRHEPLNCQLSLGSGSSEPVISPFPWKVLDSILRSIVTEI